MTAMVMLLVNIYAFGESKYEWTEISREVVSAYDEGASSSSVDIRMENGSLFIDINNVPCSDPQWYYIHTKAWESLLEWKMDFFIAYDYPPIANNVRFKYKIENFTPGKKKFEFSSYADRCFINIGRELDIYEGCKYHLEMTEDDYGYWKGRRIPFYNMEWIVYNPSDNQGKERFFQLRYGKKAVLYSHSWNDQTLKGESEVMYPLLMCDTEKFDEAKADTIAMMSAVYDLQGVTALRAYDIDIPTAFWGTGFTEETTNPSKWPSLVEAKNNVIHAYDVYEEYGGFFNFYTFYNDHFDMGFNVELTKEETPIGELTVRTIRGTHWEDRNGEWTAKWMQLYGAVGDDYASNLPYPIYDLPANVKPAYLLCVRDFTTGEVLYGDDSKLPTTLGVKELPMEPSQAIEGDGITRYYDLQGVEVKNPGHGFYIRVKDGKAEKILITE